ncbi:CLUMA_CG000436, isoform A [Clunio marinus]|uniref:CLUMA_CG000436, isoform A n=1 Tax=Clunio marinus TaxID=568069 RepID=A0A1J1HEY5_9DIPT|nr:CLUMA_CG000436, isoform A [Clunio marinus]
MKLWRLLRNKMRNDELKNIHNYYELPVECDVIFLSTWLAISVWEDHLRKIIADQGFVFRSPLNIYAFYNIEEEKPSAAFFIKDNLVTAKSEFVRHNESENASSI